MDLTVLVHEFTYLLCYGFHLITTLTVIISNITPVCKLDSFWNCKNVNSISLIDSVCNDM